jgi:hypothetical protein
MIIFIPLLDDVNGIMTICSYQYTQIRTLDVRHFLPCPPSYYHHYLHQNDEHYNSLHALLTLLELGAGYY